MRRIREKMRCSARLGVIGPLVVDMAAGQVRKDPGCDPLPDPRRWQVTILCDSIRIPLVGKWPGLGYGVPGQTLGALRVWHMCKICPGSIAARDRSFGSPRRSLAAFIFSAAKRRRSGSKPWRSELATIRIFGDS